MLRWGTKLLLEEKLLWGSKLALGKFQQFENCPEQVFLFQ